MNSKPRILLTGLGGQLGTELQRRYAAEASLITSNRSTLDLSEEGSIRAFVREAAPDIILNAAAYTAVDRAESESQAAMAINAHAPRILAEEASRRHALLVHYSTDYVFDGSKREPWLETDRLNPLNVYGSSKLAGEEAIGQVGGRYLIFRTSWVYGPHGNNFLLTMLRLGRERDQLHVVDDQTGTPTTSAALASATHSVLEKVLSGQCGSEDSWAGLYHMTCAGSVSWCGFAQAIFARAQRLLGVRTPVVLPIPTAEFPRPAQRPLYSVLSCEKLYSRFGVRLPPWQAALDAVISELPVPASAD